jgi:uncharacterized membrane protein
MIGAIVATFLTATVEWVEAYTIVLAVAVSIGWRRALAAAGAAFLVLALLVAGGSFVLDRIGNLAALQFVIGVFLILFGMRWLAKAVARGAGLKALHDEAAEFAALRGRADIFEARAAMAIAFNGVLLEGLEVWLIVVALGVQTHHTIAAASAAILALLAVAAAGAAAGKPLAKVPENTIKFTVGCGILAFGTYWTLEALGYVWPLQDFSLLALFGFNVLGGVGLMRIYRVPAA